MEHNTELLHQAFAVFLFCIAITILFVGYRSYLAVLNTANEIQKEEIIYEQYNDTNENIVTKGEIITLLFTTLEYDLEIDGLLVSKIEKVKENISSYCINNNEYLKRYAYDSNGNITRIIFTSIIN